MEDKAARRRSINPHSNRDRVRLVRLRSPKLRLESYALSRGASMIS